MKITRKEFLQSSLAIGAGIAGLGAVGCSDDTGTNADTGGGGSDTGGGSDSSGTPDTTASADSSGTTDTGAGHDCKDSNITHNHGHSLTVPRADVTAAADKSYHIKGTALHDHMITITAADFAILAKNQTVTKTSTTTNSHNHDVTVTCA